MDPSQAMYAQAVAPPPRAGRAKLYLMLGGALVVAGAVAFLVYKMRSGGTPSASTMDTVNAATSGTAQVSAAAAGAAAASGTGPAAASTTSPATVSTVAPSSTYAPVTAAPSVAASTASSPVATSASSTAAPTVAASAPTSSPLYVAYANTSVPGPTNSGLCIDAGGPFNSAALYWCWGGAPQTWNVDGGTGQVKTKSTGNCLAAADSAGASGSSVTTKACDATDSSQLWDFISGAFRLRNTTQCADSTTLGNGARLAMQPCSAGTPSQTWTKGS